MVPRSLVALMLCACVAGSAAAQQPLPPPPAATVVPTQSPAGYKSNQWRLERVTSNHFHFVGQVEIEHQSGVKFFADEMDLYTDRDLLVATGNVVFTNSEGRISAERVEFNTRSQTGTFFEAFGLMSLGAQADRLQFGNQDPDIYFYGASVERLGPKKYRLTQGAFTTCVQPTPRWELTSKSVVLNLDDYAVLRSTVLRVKGVPLLYMPFVYYPIREDERATGFLMPTYGTSTLRGQAISNAFFWAINRSQDATFLHDWFTRTGQGFGSEYRYVSGLQSEGIFRIYRFNQKQAEFQSGTTTGTLPESKSLEVTANANQMIMPGLRARSRVDYFSSIVSQQLYHQDIYSSSRRMRVVTGGLSGNWGPYSTTFAYEHNTVFNDERSSFVYGSTPRASASVAPQRVFGQSVYVSMNGEYANLPYRSDLDGKTVSDRGLTRLELAPLVRAPVSRWTFLTLNTSAAYRLTRFSESLNAIGVQVPEPFTRSFWDVRADAIGPVVTKIWDGAPTSSNERYKHVIEPTFGYQQITPIEGFRSVPILTNASDFVVGGVTRFTYGLTNRMLLRPRPREGVVPAAREFLSIAVQQTYYSDAEASQYDATYASSVQGRKLVDLSPVALTVRYAPTLATNVSVRSEHDVSGGGLQSLSATGGATIGQHSVSSSLSRRRLTRLSPAETYLSASSNLRFLEGRASANYSLSWDISRGTVVSQSITTTYYAQCCGFGVEFQNYNYPQVSSSFPIPADRRFNFSFTLAGLGTFSNFFGAFGGPR
jgi:LPS-assembly protein